MTTETGAELDAWLAEHVLGVAVIPREETIKRSVQRGGWHVGTGE